MEYPPYQLQNIVLVVLFLLCNGHKGQVMLSPPGMAPVCHGDRLNLTCTSTEAVLEWRIALNRGYSRLISTTSITSNLTIALSTSTILFTFSRKSTLHGLPLISVLSIGPANNDLNGTMVNCVDSTASNSVLTVINVVRMSEHLSQDSQINISLLSKQFESDGALVVLKWTHQNYYSYNVSVIPHLKYNISEMTKIQLKIDYNTFYNVNVMASPPCEQNSTIDFIELYYFSCRNPRYNSSNVEVIGLKYPAIEGANITFSCPPDQMLSGYNISVCNRNGEWIPDPGFVHCKAIKSMDTETTGSLIMIIVISNITMCLLCSVLCFIIGIYCRHYCHSPKQKQQVVLQEPASVQEKEGSPLYQEIQDADIQQNLAYISVQK